MKRTNRSSEWKRRGVLGVLAAAPAAALTACAGFPGQGPPPKIYRLTGAHPSDADLPNVQWQLLVETPIAPAGLNTTRIALLRTPTQLEYYAQSEWVDRVPILLQSLIIQSFENSNRIIAVGRDTLDLRADFILKIEIHNFQTEYFHGGNPLAHVSFRARLVALPRRAIVTSANFEGKAEAKADRIGDIVLAFNSATDKALNPLVAWTLKSGEANRGAA